MPEWSVSLDGDPDAAFLRAHDAACRIGRVRQASSQLRTFEAELTRMRVVLTVAVHPGEANSSSVHVSAAPDRTPRAVREHEGAFAAKVWGDDLFTDFWGEARRQFVAALGDPGFALPPLPPSPLERAVGRGVVCLVVVAIVAAGVVAVVQNFW